jgi:hypothetical protein
MYIKKTEAGERILGRNSLEKWPFRILGRI